MGIFGWDLPPGAANDPNAPWNQPDLLPGCEELLEKHDPDCNYDGCDGVDTKDCPVVKKLGKCPAIEAHEAKLKADDEMYEQMAKEWEEQQKADNSSL